MIEQIETALSITYMLNGQRHRPNGPARIWPARMGGLEEWEWWLFDRWHRYYGPHDTEGDWFIHEMWVKSDKHN